MKTQILRLEPYDDVVSIRDKMNWAKTRRILLVWPARRLRLRRLDFILLQRHARHLGVQIAIVTRDRVVRQAAQQVGLPVFRSTTEAHRAPWRYDRRRRRWRRRPHSVEQIAALRTAAHPESPAWARQPAARLALFTIAVLAVLAVGALLAPAATLHLTPLTRQDGLTLPVTAAPDIPTVNLSGALPAVWRTVEVEGRAEAPVTGQTTTPARPATGRVVFTNLTGHPVSVPEGTVVLGGNPPVRFATTRPLTVPAGGEADAIVRALDWGSRGNLPAGSLTSLLGDLGLQLRVTNPAPTHGGADTPVAAPAALDRSRLYSRLRSELAATALQELQASLAPDDLLIADSLEPVQVLQRTYDPPDNRPSDTLRLTLRMTFRALVVRGDDLRSLAEGIRQTQLLPGYRPLPDTLTWTSVTTPTRHGERITWRLHIRWQSAAVIRPEVVTAALAGQSQPAAEHWLRTHLPLAAPPRITLTPAWWPRLPWLPFRIRVVLGEGKQNAN